MSKHVLLLGLVAIGCGGSTKSNDTADAPPAPGSTVVGPSGGTVTGADNGPTLQVPPGALSEPVTITVTATMMDVAGATTPVYQFEPDGLQFEAPVVVTIPVANPSSSLSVYWSRAGGEAGYDKLDSAVAASGMSASVTHFSTGYVGPAVETAVGVHYHYVIDSMTAPTNSQEVRDSGLDLDGIGAQSDNGFGSVLSTFEAQGLSFASNITAGIDTGEALTLAEVVSPDLTTATSASFGTFIGTNPTPAACSGTGDTVCRHHLDGAGSFSIDASSPADSVVSGALASGALNAGPGHLALPFALERGNAFVLNLIGARTRVTVGATSLSGIIAGGITAADVSTKLMPAIAHACNSLVTASCTASGSGCTCVSGSQGASAQSILDTNDDCTVSVSEVEGNAVIQSMFAPDVTVEGQNVLSFGIPFTAVSGTYTVP